MTDDLQTRLREQNARKWRLATGGAPINSGYKSLEEEAADHIDELEAEVERLTAQLADSCDEARSEHRGCPLL